MGKTELWDRLGKTDPTHTKAFQRAGGFKGTAIKPIWSYRRLTEEFGPCGTGWGINEPMFQVVHAEGEILVYCTVSIWHGQHENVVFGVGGDKVMGKNRNGTFTDDEAFKKAFTDAVTNAMKSIGVGADVHMGLFEDDKYVAAIREEFAREEGKDSPPEGHVIKRQDGIQVLTVDAQRPIFNELEEELNNCDSVDDCKRWVISAKSRASHLSGQWRDELNKRYLKHLRAIEKRDADEYIERHTA